LSLILLLVSLASGIIQGTKVSSTIKNTIAAISASLAALVASGATTLPSEATILAGLAGVIAAAKQDPDISAADLNILAGLDDAVAAALAADKVAQTKVDTTQLNPIVPLP
jgi:hypothetical protein